MNPPKMMTMLWRRHSRILFVAGALASHVVASVANSKPAKPPLVSTGLRNLGNTCYMNAQLQCAFHIPAVRRLATQPAKAALTIDESNDEGEEESADANAVAEEQECNAEDLPQQQEQEQEQEQSTERTTIKQIPAESVAATVFRELIEEMQNAAIANGAPIQPRSFSQKLGIPVMVQQDAQEFWKLLLPAVDNEDLTDLYKGCFEDYITALDGSGRERRRQEVFLDLSLDVAGSSSLEHSITKAFMKPELLSVAEGNGWRPEKGADKVDAHKGWSLITAGLPPILQVHLKRFNYDWMTDKTTKLHDKLSAPLLLDLAVFAKPVDSTEEKGADDKSNKSGTIYHLQSIVVHAGEYGAGHYYAYVRPDVRVNKWYRFNDHSVEQVAPIEVATDVSLAGWSTARFPGGFLSRIGRLFNRIVGGKRFSGWGGAKSSAYVLQYIRESDIPHLYD